MLIDTPTYDKLAARLAAHDAWAEQFKQRSGWIVIPADANPPRAAKISNAGRAMIEVYEFRRDVPDRYFLYINERTRRATTWTGAPLGVVIFGR